MRLWEQTTSARFITEMPEGGNHCQQYSFEILKFARSDFSDSHTATMTAERKKLRELPRINTNVTNVTIKDHPRRNNPSFTNANVIQSPDQTKSDQVTQNGARVKFAMDQNHRRTQTESNVNVDLETDSKEDHHDHNDHNHNSRFGRKKKLKYTAKQLKALRRASAPAKGMDYYFKNAKLAATENDKSPVEEHNKNKFHLSIPTVHIEMEEPTDDHHDHNHHDRHDDHHDHDHDNEENHDETNIHHHHHHHHHHNHNNHHHASSSISSSVTSSSSIISSSEPPCLSPCSSTSSMSSSIDMLNPSIGKPPQFSPNFINPWARPKSKSISSDNPYQSESTSLPDLINSYDENTPWSPAALFLSGFANPDVKKALPDDEGQQVGEYIIGKVIARGGFSTVKQACTMDSYSGSMETVAVKVIRNHPGSDDNDRIQALLEREITIWSRLDHPNVVPMLSVVEDDYATFVFSEYCPGGTLLQHIKELDEREGRLDEEEARNIFLEIAESIRYLHNDMRLVHKDIKLENILLDKDDTWRICDFGLTEFQNAEANGFNNILYRDVGGSLAYCAPEQLRSPTPLKDPSVDIWSLGVVLFAMITGQLPFNDSFEPRLQLKILNGRYDESLLDRASDELKDLLRGMFKTKPDQRLTISQILEHQWCER